MKNSGHAAASSSRRARPCDICRKRKRRCVVESGNLECQLCESLATRCTFAEPAVERSSLKRSAPESAENGRSPRSHNASNLPVRRKSQSAENADSVIEDYDTLPVPSLLKTNLGLQQHRYIQYIGPSDEFETNLLALRPVDGKQETRFPNGTSCRRVSRDTHFALTPYSGTQVRADEIAELDRIEAIVRPHGKRLVNLYFRIIHPCFPILDKKTFMEKYARTYHEFSPPCLAGVYMLASKWWYYDRELSSQPKPDIEALEHIARRSLQAVIDRPKLSTIQGGLLLLQCHGSGNGSWALSSQMVAVAQELGLDSNCADWAIPTWEKGLRTRLGWAIFMMDKWMALCRGRPSHIIDDNWTPDSTSDGHLWDNLDSEDDDRSVEGSTESVRGGMAFERMISLTHIVSEILQKFYSRKALADISSNVRTVLEQIKPVQVRLREWHRDLPELLHLDASTPRQLSPVAALHLSYFAAEIALHRVISSSLLRHPCDPQLVRICRDAAKERVTSAVSLVTELKVQDLQSFWYFPSGYCLITIGTFTALLFVTSQSASEAELYKRTLDDYRWFLRVSSSSTEYMRDAVKKLDIALSHVHELTAADIVGPDVSVPEPQNTTQPPPFNERPSSRRQHKGSRTAESAALVSTTSEVQAPLFYEDAILDALSAGFLLGSPLAQHYNFPPSLIPQSPGVDVTNTSPQTLDYDFRRPE